jgi:hypothetical protein
MENAMFAFTRVTIHDSYNQVALKVLFLKNTTISDAAVEQVSKKHKLHNGPIAFLHCKREG